MVTKTDLRSFEDMLKKHDWFYNYSDDHNAWRAGKDNLASLRKKAEEHQIYRNAFNIWETYMFYSKKTQKDSDDLKRYFLTLGEQCDGE